MFKSQTLIKQQQVIDSLGQENERLQVRIRSLEDENRELQSSIEQLESSKEAVLNSRVVEAQQYEQTLDQNEEEKSMLNDAKAELEKRYNALLSLLGRVKMTFQEQAPVVQTVSEKNISVMEEDLDQLLRQVEEFHRSVETIKKISNELELLGVNATIQAAHAGEKGKGFLIVADHINKLSQHSKKNVEEALHQLTLFTQITKGLTHDFSKTVQSIENNMNAFHELNELMNKDLVKVKKDNIETSDRM
jgi:methyl-accepting chemotaxis protein